MRAGDSFFKKIMTAEDTSILKQRRKNETKTLTPGGGGGGGGFIKEGETIKDLCF